MSQIETKHDPQQQRYEAYMGGQLAGFAEYRDRDGAVELSHTEVGEEFGGQGVGSALARFTLDSLRDQGAQVIPSCSFMAGWIDKHPDYQDMLAR